MEMENRMQHFQVKCDFITKALWKQVEISVNIQNHALAMASILNLYAEKYKQCHSFSEIIRDDYRTGKQDFSPHAH